METRNRVFQQLKPRCVALSQTALALNGPRANLHAVTNDLSELKNTLSSIIETPNSLDEKLADYVFFPLSQVLKASQRVSVRCLELSLQCLSILIDQGWRSKLQPQLAGQVMILCTLLAEKKPKGLSVAETTNELQEGALHCLYLIFLTSKADSESRLSLISESNIPQLGATISVILDGVEDGGSPNVQIVASKALQALLKDVATQQIHASFLPGVVSRLTKVLTVQTKQRRSPSVLIRSLEIFGMLLLSVVADNPKLGPNDRAPYSQRQVSEPSVVDEDWIKTTSTQMKSALTTIVRLKSHSRGDVREALAGVCLILVGRCEKNLANCTPLALDTLIALLADSSDSPIRSKLVSLARDDSTFSIVLQDTTYQKLQSLPTAMQLSDMLLKVRRLEQVRAAYGILIESGSDTTTLDKVLAKILGESVVITILSTSSRAMIAELDLALPTQKLDIAVAESNRNKQFSASLVRHRGQEDILDKILQLSKLASRSTPNHTFRTDLMRSLHQTQGDMQLATYWLLLNATEHTVRNDYLVDQFINDAIPISSVDDESLETLYSFGLSILSESSESARDVRLQSLALRSLALQAQVSKEEFRYELIDALYPVLHSLATPDEILEHDSIVALDILASACGYDDVKALIIENVDYLTNAVALKLNAFDVSPQAPRVLLMMVKLAGPTLLPYLGDTIESIFAAIEDYHGYPLLVELLFKVLGVVAEEGTKAEQLAVTDSVELKLLHNSQSQVQPLNISSLVELLQDRAEEDARSPQKAPTTRQAHPQQPWKSERDASDDEQSNPDSDNPEDPADEEPTQQSDPPDIPPPAPKIYSVLLKIASLTQHFLPSASPSLRTSLLSLLHTTIPSLARHENSFLPLINVLWPEITSRLDDPEPQILVSALEVISLLCEYAGDFMRTRIVRLWPRVMEIYRLHHAKGRSMAAPTTRRENRSAFRSRGGKEGGPSSGLVLPVESALLLRPPAAAAASTRDMGLDLVAYDDTLSASVRKAITNVITAIVRHVDTSPEIFDEALLALEGGLDEPDIRSALESANADAVWLVRMRSGGVSIPVLPGPEKGSRDWKFAMVPY